ncbi:MAG: hypothetical protein EP338_00420 [Bacteroidetes bacterium]|nr:MAG: hypothetical protein EP338_00420 [Bacteroidota bacterium]
MIQRIILFSILFVGIISCVPSKKYYDLVEREKSCNEELNKYKSDAITFEAQSKELEANIQSFRKDVDRLKRDTLKLGKELRSLQVQYDRVVLYNMAVEKKLDEYKEKNLIQTGTLQSNLDSKNLELQRKEDALLALEKELKTKQALLVDREKKVNELEEALRRKDEGVKALKNKVSQALRTYENKGLSVVEKNGKIYVSLEAKLLFQSGSTDVEETGKKALVDLSRVLEKEKDLEIVVEGHTDSDELKSQNHPKNNWELSVLRATSVIEIMIANSKIDPTKLMAAGRSMHHPVDAKDKAKNRRIEIIISPDLNALFELISK